jgi:type IV pilus assembly protein PilE
MTIQSHGRLTLIELATLAVALAVVAAIAVPLWQSHRLDERRAEARTMLEGLLKAQDAYFGAHSRYADGKALHAGLPHGPGLQGRSGGGHYEFDIELGADALSYVAIARGVRLEGERYDLRCHELRIDHQGRRMAADTEGRDTSADCWSRL